MRNKFYYEVVKTIKQRFPLRYPVHVRRCTTPQDRSGDCWFDTDKKRYLIRIDKKLNQHWAIDVFVHEYAHALSWRSEKLDHDEAWGLAYSEVYRALLEFWHLKPEEQKVAKFKLQ